MGFMDVADLVLAGIACVVSRSGYTGEDGFEISLPAADAAVVAEALLADDRVLPIGLGARDSLRLEAGLCLYGAGLDTRTTTVESRLEWAMPKVRRPGGSRSWDERRAGKGCVSQRTFWGAPLPKKKKSQ